MQPNTHLVVHSMSIPSVWLRTICAVLCCFCILFLFVSYRFVFVVGIFYYCSFCCSVFSLVKSLLWFIFSTCFLLWIRLMHIVCLCLIYYVYEHLLYYIECIRTRVLMCVRVYVCVLYVFVCIYAVYIYRIRSSK